MKATHIAFQSIVPVRSHATDAAEMVTQLLFGEWVMLLERERQWLRVACTWDGYEGWVDEKAVLPVDHAWLESNPPTGYVRTHALQATCDRGSGPEPLLLTLGSRIPAVDAASGLATVTIGNAVLRLETSALQLAAVGTIEGVLAASDSYLGAPYLWGGRSPWGIDCSGFTQMVFGLNGIHLPRDASQQIAIGAEVSYAQRRPGDLAFFVNASGKVHHVGLVTADGNVRHASGHVHDAQLSPEGILGKYTGKQTHTLCNIKRIV